MQRSGADPPTLVRVWRCPSGTPYLGFCPPGPPLRLHITNGYELWTGDNCLDKLDGDFSKNRPSPYENCVSKLQEIMNHQTTTLTVHEATATIQFQSLTFDLCKVPLDEAKKPLQDLVFGLVDRVQAMEGAFKEGPSITTPLPLNSPEKTTLRSQILIASGRSPPKSVTRQTSAKKRLPGESLINPGFKSKKTPTGVDFEDP